MLDSVLGTHNIELRLTQIATVQKRKQIMQGKIKGMVTMWHR